MNNPLNDVRFTRRNMLMAGGASAAGAAAGGLVPAPVQAMASSAPSPEQVSTAQVSFEVNGKPVTLELDTRTTLLDALREHLKLTGTKKGCDHGQCGACTAIVDGRRINTCLTFAVMHQGARITTIEGLGQPGALHPMQAAFVRHDGYQCGYCTPGQICSAVGMLGEIRAGQPSHVSADLSAAPSASDEEVRERMSGNLCRCAAYPNIVAAVEQAARELTVAQAA